MMTDYGMKEMKTMMTEEMYYRELTKMPPRRMNELISAVNAKRPLSALGRVSEVEKMFYERTYKEAEELEVKHGKWPEFMLCELD